MYALLKYAQELLRGLRRSEDRDADLDALEAALAEIARLRKVPA